MSRARVVAKAAQAEHTDVAVIHVDAELPWVFDWAGDDRLQNGAAVIAVGCADGINLSKAMKYVSQSCLAGKISAVRGEGDGTQMVLAKIPLRKGDSGGPLVSTDGGLIGIDSKGTSAQSHEVIGIAVRPDRAWLARTIEQDRLRQIHDAQPPIPAAARVAKSPTLIVALDGEPPIESAGADQIKAVRAAP